MTDELKHLTERVNLQFEEISRLRERVAVLETQAVHQRSTPIGSFPSINPAFLPQQPTWQPQYTITCGDTNK